MTISDQRLLWKTGRRKDISRVKAKGAGLRAQGEGFRAQGEGLRAKGDIEVNSPFEGGYGDVLGKL
jgi:hypothetical protein